MNITTPNISQLPKSLQNQIQQSPEQPDIPSEDTLRLLIANGLSSIAATQIQTHNLPYYIDANGQLRNKEKGALLHLKRFITEDPDTVQMKQDIIKMSKCDDPVLIHGETGTGKELIARALIGNRQELFEGDAKFLAVNCAGLPSELIESELFGHVRGAFTGAGANKTGILSAAANGVAFLDEIGELPIEVQGKLLRAIQERTVRPVGANDELPIKCKFVFATNRDLKKMVLDGSFRKDLFARISVFEVFIKPLEERKCDIIPIIKNEKGGKELLDYCMNNGINPQRDFDLEFNVRSLQKYVRQYAVLNTVKVKL